MTCQNQSISPTNKSHDHTDWSQYIEYSVEISLEFLPGDETLLIPALDIKKDPCSNVDPVVKQLCQDSPVDCPDVSLRHCEENNLEAGGNCFIQDRDSYIMSSLTLFWGIFILRTFYLLSSLWNPESVSSWLGWKSKWNVLWGASNWLLDIRNNKGK